jgi:hypothetical protein
MRNETHYTISRELQDILQLRNHTIPVLDYVRLMHPEDSGRIMHVLERAAQHFPEAVVVRDPVRIQSMPNVWLAFTSAAILVEPPPKFVYVGRARRVRCD